MSDIDGPDRVDVKSFGFFFFALGRPFVSREKERSRVNSLLIFHILSNDTCGIFCWEGAGQKKKVR